MNIKVSPFTVSEKYINTTYNIVHSESNMVERT